MCSRSRRTESHPFNFRQMEAKKKLVISTGAGMSAESGIATFRDAGGLWDRYPVMQVASHDGYLADPALIHRFYNKLRHELVEARPNAGHLALAALEHDFDVDVITQNVDNLHERAGSTRVLHLHGELMKMEATDDPGLTFTLPDDNGGSLDTGVDTVIQGHHVRPHIVFFQEAVPNFEPAAEIVRQADIFVVIGTSLVVYPAAALIRYVRPGVPVYYIDPNPAQVPDWVHVIREPAGTGVATLARLLEKDR